jgi:hypothetical protein
MSRNYSMGRPRLPFSGFPQHSACKLVQILINIRENPNTGPSTAGIWVRE